MRSLVITLYAQKPACLPLSYNALIQGALYDCWRQGAPSLHNEGFTDGSRTYRLFTFSQLSGKSHVDSKKKTISVTGVITFRVRSPEEDLIDLLAQELAAKGSLRIGRAVLPIVNLSTADRLLFPHRALINMLSPVTLHRTLDDGYTEYLDPRTRAFAEALQVNCEHKAQSFGFDCCLVQLVPLDESLRKRVIQFKGTYVNGWTGQFILSAEPETMAFLYNAGLGDRNSQGFGMFEIIDRPLAF